jgi:signal transduction histidine kinase
MWKAHHTVQIRWSAESFLQSDAFRRSLQSIQGRDMSFREQSELQAENDALYEALRNAEERAIAGQLALETMHEIRNPLEALGNLTFLTQQEAEDPERVRQYMSLAEEQIRNGSRVASKTLAFARSSRVLQRADLVGVAEAALRIHQPTIQSKKVRLVKCLPEELVGEVHVGELLQAMSNLIANALEALPLEGALHLRLRRRSDRMQILISDNGHGIPEEHMKKIFRPFYTTKEPRGTGLGLAITKSIVDKHGGSLRVKSSIRAGKSGTTFLISLPGIVPAV